MKKNKSTNANSSEFSIIPLSSVVESKSNPRKTFDPKSLAELTQSILEKGVIEPIIVRRVGKSFEIVAGARRFRAAVNAKVSTIPCIVRDLSDAEALEFSVIENNQREDVHPVEESDGFAALVSSGTYGKGADAIEAIASKLGRTPAYVRQRIALHSLCDEARKEWLNGLLTFAHAHMLMRLSPEIQLACVKHVVYETKYNSKTDSHVPSKTRRKEPKSPSSLKEFIQKEFVREIAKASFDTSDALLIKQAGACTSCPKRSSVQSNLFGEGKGPDLCLDGSCFALKTKQSLIALIETERKKHSKVILFGGYRDLDGLGAKEDRNKYEIARQSEEGAIRAIVIDTWSSDFGKCKWVKKRKSSSSQSNKFKEQEKERARNAKVENLYRHRLITTICEKGANIALDEILIAFYKRCDQNTQKTIARIMSWEFIKSQHGHYSGDATIDSVFDSLDASAKRKLAVCLFAQSEIAINSYSNAKPERLETLAKSMKIDTTKLKRSVTVDLAPKVKPNKQPAKRSPAKKAPVKGKKRGAK